jgi:hypothetical protein
MEIATRRFVELEAGGPDDPDGMRTATVLSAYFHAEQMRAFRQVLWRGLSVAAAIWLVAGATTSVLSRPAMITGLSLIVAAAICAAVLEWRAGCRLNELLGPPGLTR